MPSIFFLIALLLSACSTTPTTTQEYSAPADKALVVFFRPKTFVSGGYKPHIYINGKYFIRSVNGRYATAIVEPGWVVFSILSPGDQRLYSAGAAAAATLMQQASTSGGDVCIGHFRSRMCASTAADMNKELADMILRNRRLTIDANARAVIYVDWGPGRPAGRPMNLVEEQSALAAIVSLKRQEGSFESERGAQ